jgi:toxin-antitoxin system PIN domain toxin
MRRLLPDINIWVAYAVEAHPHHELVKTRWRTLEEADLFFCRVTQMGLLRILTQPKAMGISVLSAKGAWELWERLAREQQVEFVEEQEETGKCFREYSDGESFSFKRWTDAYLAAFARSGGMGVLTLDKGFKNFAGAEVVCWEEEG